MKLVILLSILLAVNVTSGCKCRPRTDKENLCGNDFAGVVEITGDNNDADGNCGERDKCATINIAQAWKGSSFQPTMLSTFASSAGCGISRDMPTSGFYVVSGYISNGAKGVRLASCSYILEEVESLDDPKVEQYHDLLKSCPPPRSTQDTV